MNNFFHTHVHSEFSVLDGMPTVASIVSKAVDNGQPAIGLTDHGNMSGIVQLYKASRKAGLLPFPGEEFYLVPVANDPKSSRYHITMFALTTEGYHSLVELSTLSHRRERYHYKPRIEFADLIEMGAQGRLDGVVATTGCYFGLVQQRLVEHGYDAALDAVKMYRDWFPNLFVEIQHHHTPIGGENKMTDDELVTALHQLSFDASVPVLITNDSHYCDKKDRELHDLMKTIAYKAADPGDVQFPGDSYHLGTTQWVRSHYYEHGSVWDDSEDSFEWLLNEHKLTIPNLDNYRYYMPQLADQPLVEVKKRCRKQLRKLGKDHKEYMDRLDYELDVVSELGMADYFLIIAKITDYCRSNGVLVNARGSANGCLIAYLMQITQVDPIEWDLSFERFLSRDRTKPPDIDLDIEDIFRTDVIDYMAQEFEVCQIGTYGRMGYSDDGEGRGGVFVQFVAAERSRLGKDGFKQQWGDLKGLHDVVSIDRKLGKQLQRLGEMNIRRSAGAHAAGFILSSDAHPMEKWVPTMLIPSSNTTVTQYMMDDVEDMGFPKVDALGLRSLTTVRRCLELINRDPFEGLDWIPHNDSRTMRLFRQGRTNTGIFQFEGYTAAKGCREVQVRTVHDLILVNALYRPATMNAGMEKVYLQNRSNPSAIDWLHPIWKKVLEPTFGVPVYQEQIMDLLRELGFDVDRLNAMLKAIKASNDKVTAAEGVFRDTEIEFKRLCKKAGMTSGDADSAWVTVQQFSDYSFNKSHSTGYGLLGYRMGYLKVHYPLAFHSALLETTVGTPKEKEYVAEARRLGITLLPPDVNVSEESWTIDLDKDGIRRGLTSIGGVGDKAAEEIIGKSPFKSMEDLIARTDSRAVNGGKDWEKHGTLNGVLAKLAQAGALKSLGVGRYD